MCPRHRELYGMRWRCNKTKCSSPVDWAPHKSKLFKGDCGITSIQSTGLYYLANCLLPVWHSYRISTRLYRIVFFSLLFSFPFLTSGIRCVCCRMFVMPRTPFPETCQSPVKQTSKPVLPIKSVKSS